MVVKMRNEIELINKRQEIQKKKEELSVVDFEEEFLFLPEIAFENTQNYLDVMIRMLDWVLDWREPDEDG